MHKLNPLNPLVGWINDLITIFSEESIKIPSNFHTQVSKIKDLLQSDVSGLVNSVLDFAIGCALVNYKIETTNVNLTGFLTEWLKNINSDLRGKVPVGVKGLAEQYFIERWKNSSLCILRTLWEDVKIGNTTFYLPTRLWFVDGGDIYIEEDGETAHIGEEIYKLKISKSKKISLPTTENEIIFVNKPHTQWGTDYPVPFIIQRGIFRNLKFLSLLSKKGESVVGKAIEYIFKILKGDKDLFIQKNISYSPEDLKKVKEDFKEIAEKRKTEPGIPTYASQFDTDMEHLIPDYSKVLQQALYSPIEKKILSGLGFIEVIEGVTTSRREGVLNPKVFITEVERAIEDFKSLLTDVLETIREKNTRHRKYVGEITEVTNTPIQSFITEKMRQELRIAYIYGQLSHQTFIEVVCGLDYDLEVERRMKEAKNNIDKILYPHLTQNIEDKGLDLPEFDENGDPIPRDKIDKEQKKLYELSRRILEQAPYNLKNYPNYLNKYPKGAREAWISAFNSALRQYKDETKAFKVAWSALKTYMRKHKLKLPKKGKK